MKDESLRRDIILLRWIVGIDFAILLFLIGAVIVCFPILSWWSLLILWPIASFAFLLFVSRDSLNIKWLEWRLG